MTHIRTALLFSLVLLLAAASAARAQQVDWKNFHPHKVDPQTAARLMEEYGRMMEDALAKIEGDPREEKSLIINGNKITTIVYNTGTITRPNTLYNTADLVWNRLGYGFEFTPIVGGEVIDADGRTVHILNDGMYLQSEGDYDPNGVIRWGWLPKPGYAAPEPNRDIASWSARSAVGGDLTRRPPSWPESWYNPILGRYVWPAYLGNDASSPDEEVYFVTDDYSNAEFKYFPFPDDSSKRGLGLDLECRFFQFNNPLAEDIIFLVYRVTNRSPKTLDKVYFGMYGDPHIGGGTFDFGDDLAYFIPPTGPRAEGYAQRARNMVYAWDNDNKGEGGIVPGYFGFKFLESPTHSSDGVDNDDDGIVDESPFNDAGDYIDGTIIPLTAGIADTAKYLAVYGSIKPRWSGDENGNWDAEKHDTGLDGLPGTGDFGEGNGKPDVGVVDGNITAEPQFGIRDVNESDQIGLTSFWALPYGGVNYPSQDELFWGYLAQDTIAIDQELFSTPGDNIFLYGSGPFRLEPGATQRFSIALMMGENLNDLLLNSETAQRILEANYQFAQPPPKPVVRAVPGDGRVTLYWDNLAEETIDPLTGTKDFEGYKIYRSEDYTFADVYKVTDANGNAFLGVPMVGADGRAAQFDVVNTWSGLHPIEYQGRGVKYQLGSNSGLVHEYVDSTVTNGKTYYYAVASYDHGFDSLGISLPPSESQISIKRDAVTGALTLDVNTAAITPGPLASGIKAAQVSNNFAPTRVAGNATGELKVGVLDNYQVINGGKYDIHFLDDGGKVKYNVESNEPLSETVVTNDTFFIPLTRKNIINTDFTLLEARGAVVDPARYQLDAAAGRIRGAYPGALPVDGSFTARYLYYAVYLSDRVQGEDDNPVFEGMRIYVTEDPLGVDSLTSGWLGATTSTMDYLVQKPQGLPSSPFIPAPIDLEIRWNRTDTTANGKWMYPGDTLLNNQGRKVVVCPFKVVNVTDTSKVRVLIDRATTDSLWRPGREIIALTPPNYAPQTGNPKMVGVLYNWPAAGDRTLPTEGNVFKVNSTKPFVAGDSYTFSTTAAAFDPGTATSALDKIYVVPNPYVAYSDFEGPGSNPTLRGDRRLQFRNLPPTCTVRIFTMTGELVDTIYKDDTNSYVNWGILSYEGQRLAYGVYIYHVDVPGVGEKIGRFALIK